MQTEPDYLEIIRQLQLANEKAEQRRQKAEEERLKAEQEKQKAEQQRQKAEEEKERLEQEKKKAEQIIKKIETHLVPLNDFFDKHLTKLRFQQYGHLSTYTSNHKEIVKETQIEFKQLDNIEEYINRTKTEFKNSDFLNDIKENGKQINFGNEVEIQGKVCTLIKDIIKGTDLEIQTVWESSARGENLEDNIEYVGEEELNIYEEGKLNDASTNSNQGKKKRSHKVYSPDIAIQ